MLTSNIFQRFSNTFLLHNFKIFLSDCFDEQMSYQYSVEFATKPIAFVTYLHDKVNFLYHGYLRDNLLIISYDSFMII